jgi:hypothetical protein
VDRDAFRQKQKNPFQEKVIISISRGKRGLQSRKTFSWTKKQRARRFCSRTLSGSLLPTALHPLLPLQLALDHPLPL